jgi:hypothetical protein
VRTPVIVATAILVLSVPAAQAAGTLDKSTVAANTDTDLTLDVSVDQLGAYDDRVVLEVPTGFRVLACSKAAEFTCAQSSAGQPSRTVLTWKRTTPGTPVPLAVDHFAFRVRTIDRAGAYVFAVHQFYSDNTTADSAAKLTVTASPARPAPTTTTLKKAPVVRSGSAASPSHSAANTMPAVAEPAWLAESDTAGAPPVEIGTETSRVRQSAPMVGAGLVAAVAAVGVFSLRRRAAPTR